MNVVLVADFGGHTLEKLSGKNWNEATKSFCILRVSEQPPKSCYQI